VASSGNTTTGLSQIASSDTSFGLTNTIVGRIYVVTPTASADLISLSGPNGLTYTIADDFTTTSLGGLDYHISNYDTQFTGTNVKTFVLNYA